MKGFLKSLAFALLSVVAVGVQAQDVASDPVSLYRPTEVVDTVAPHFMLLNEDNIIPSDEMYPTWTNSVVHYNSVMPDSFRIDLRNYAMPTPSTKITDIFGYRPNRRRLHQGMDIKVQTGDTIYAAFDGKVRITSYQRRGYGYYVVIRHNNGIETLYAHLSKRLVEEGEWVNAGDVIGHGGSTGRSTGPHLHFETRYQGFAFDPQWLIDFKTGQLRHRLFVLKKKYFNIYSNYEQDFEDEMKNHEEDKAEDAEREAMRWYTIKSGDTLGRIAINNNTTVSELCRLNGINRNTTLKIGKKIRVR